MRKFLDKMFAFIEGSCKIAMIVQIISVTIVVIGRQLFNKTPAWGEELTLFALVWMSLVGSVVLLREHGHISVTVFDKNLPPRIIKILDFLSYLFLSFFSITMIIYGTKLLDITSRNVMPALGIKSSWMYLSIPVSSAMMLIVIAEQIYNLFTQKNYVENIVNRTEV